MRLSCDSNGNIAISADTNFEMQWLYNLRGALHGDVEVYRESNFVGARTLRISPPSEQAESTDTTDNSASPKLLDEIESYAVECDRAGIGCVARKVRSWVKQLRAGA